VAASKLRNFVFVTGALMTAAVVQAQQPSQSPKSSSTAASAPTASQTTQKPAANQPAKTAPAQTQTDPSPVLIRDARNAGFRPEHIRGTLMFCRTAKELGSNFPVRTCYNETQTRIKIEEYQAERNQLNGMHGNGVTGN
jgi:hypothetical protein